MSKVYKIETSEFVTHEREDALEIMRAVHAALKEAGLSAASVVLHEQDTMPVWKQDASIGSTG